jgi:hypothetical protein
MSIGTALFLSTLVIGLIILYGITRDRWNWKAIAKRTGLAVFVIVLVGLLTAGGFYLWNNLPVGVQTQYAGLKVGMHKDEVKYVKGMPTDVLEPLTTEGEMKGWQGIITTSELLKQGKSVDDYNTWQYDLGEARLDLDFDPQSRLIVVSCYSPTYSSKCPSIGGLTVGVTEKEIVSRLGAPDDARLDGITKSLYYKNLGIYFTLEKERVYMIGVNVVHYRRS